MVVQRVHLMDADTRELGRVRVEHVDQRPGLAVRQRHDDVRAGGHVVQEGNGGRRCGDRDDPPILSAGAHPAVTPRPWGPLGDFGHETRRALLAGRTEVEDEPVNGRAEEIRLTGEVADHYGPSPLLVHDRAVRSASELIALDVTRASIVFELRQQFGLSEDSAVAAMREAVAQMPRRPTAPPAGHRVR